MGEAGTSPGVVRNTRPTRWLHASVYLTTMLAGVTGIGLWGEGVPRVADLLGGHTATASLHRWAGYAVAVPPIVALLLRPRAVGRFLDAIVQVDAADLAWWRRFPLFLLAPGRWPLPRHRGHFDPGQRVMAWALVATLAVVVVSGALMIVAVDALGPRYGLVLRTHTVSSVALGAFVVGHLVVSTGIPKGYRGVWRAMHAPGRGRVPRHLAHRLWPAWLERQEPDDTPEGDRGD